MVLQLASAHLKQMTTHAEHTYPQECCGLLIGRSEQDDEGEHKTLVEVWATQNLWNAEAEAAMQAVAPATTSSQLHSKRDRYWIDPKDILNAQRYARDRQLTIIGIYHSHPDHVAVPSECDRSLAWSRYSYIIISVQQGIAQEARCWCLDAQDQFQPEKIIILDDFNALDESEETSLNS